MGWFPSRRAACVGGAAMNNAEVAIVWFLMILSAIFATRAEAGTLVTPTIPGYASGLYKPYVNPGYTPGALSGNGTINLGGRPVSVPAQLAPSANAADYAKRGLFNNPWLVGPALLLWPSEAGNGDLVLNPDAQRWEKAGPPLPSLPLDRANQTMYTTCTQSASTCKQYVPMFSSPAGVCQAYTAGCYVNGMTAYVLDYQGDTTYTALPIVTYTNVCPQGYATMPSECQMKWSDYVDPENTEKVPATEDDFLALPDPPMSVYDDMAPQIGVPVESPTFEPLTVPIGDPYKRWDGAEVQPWANITDAGQGQVTVDTYEKVVVDVQGNPVPQEQQQPEDTPEPELDQCQKYPNTVGCASLDVPTPETMPTESRGIAELSPVAVGGVGQCPAPLTANVAGRTIEFSFDLLCDYADALRPLVLALAWLSAGMLFIQGVRNG